LNVWLILLLKWMKQKMCVAISSNIPIYNDDGTKKIEPK